LIGQSLGVHQTGLAMISFSPRRYLAFQRTDRAIIGIVEKCWCKTRRRRRWSARRRSA
jgi:hypothetical protein